jgi:hypothetical protein
MPDWCSTCSSKENRAEEYPLAALKVSTLTYVQAHMGKKIQVAQSPLVLRAGFGRAQQHALQDAPAALSGSPLGSQHCRQFRANP